MLVRTAKIALVAAVGLYLALVVFNNLTDYGSNYVFVRHVLTMDTTFPENAGMWRAINSAAAAHAFYLAIILCEMASCGVTLAGAWRLWGLRGQSAGAFNRGKSLATAGLAINLLQWLVAFIAVGGEWFLMWQSQTWNASETAGRMFMIAGITLLFVNAEDQELT